MNVDKLQGTGLLALLLAITSACGDEASTTEGDTSDADAASDPTPGSGCGSNEEHVVEVPASAVAEYEPFGPYPDAACYELCESAPTMSSLADYAITCEPATQRGGEPTSSSSSDGSSSDGSSSDGGGSSTDTSGSETTSGSSDTVGDESSTGGGTVMVRCEFDFFCLGGRLSRDLHAPIAAPLPFAPAVARWAAAMAHAEAASIVSFLRLGAALSRHGAPADLVAGCRDAARDEARHARVMRALARRGGATVARPQHRPASPRSLVELAIENAVEGCVRETWAALLAVEQSRSASDPHVRRAMASIAIDEARHAELSWSIARWLETQLDADDVAHVRAARDRARDELVAAFESPTARNAALGLPDAAHARALVTALGETLWS